MNFLNVFFYLATAILFNSGCKKNNPVNGGSKAYRIVKEVSFNNVRVNVVIDKPVNDTMDVLVVYHGTVVFDSKILEAAHTTLNGFKNILDRTNMMVVSVAYPEENLLMGDNIKEAEAALLWVKNVAAVELGISMKKIFLGGHSQGGYLVTRLNTMHITDGVVANAPGPIDLAYRCGLEETGQVPGSITCNLMKNNYGTTTANPGSYLQRSLISFTGNYKSDILFVQGLDDSPIQMFNWPNFKQQVNNCTTCKGRQFVEVANFGHGSLFESAVAKQAFNNFINR